MTIDEDALSAAVHAGGMSRLHTKRIIEAYEAVIAPLSLSTGTVYEHYKGGRYTKLYEARMEANLAPVVIYQGEDGQVWVRPKDEWDAKFRSVYAQP